MGRAPPRRARPDAGPTFSLTVTAAAALLAGFGVVAALAAALAEVLEDVLVGDGINAVDGPTTTWLAAHREPWLTAALKGVSLLGNTAAEVTVAVLVSVAVTWRSGKWLPAVLGLIGTAGIGLLILTAKLVVGRSRPALPYAIVSEDGYSFPSGHATGTAAVGLLCAWMLSRWLVTSWTARVAVWSVAVGVTGAVGFSRVYLGVHYVSDVRPAGFLGAAWAGAVMLVGVWWENTRAVTASGTSAGLRMQRQHQTGDRQQGNEVDRQRDSRPGEEHAAEGQQGYHRAEGDQVAAHRAA